MGIDLLLQCADDRRPALAEGLPEQAAFMGPRPELAKPRVLRDRGGDLDDLRIQRWAVVIADTSLGERQLELVAPLVALRREEQGGVPVEVYRVRPGMTAAASIAWRRDVYERSADDEESLPLYLLILGDFDAVSIAFQEVMATSCFVGRIAFSEEEGYRAYADKVARWQARPHPAAAARAVLFTVKDDPATALGYQSLMSPTLAQLRRARGGVLPDGEMLEIAGDEVGRAELFGELTRPGPVVLFSMSHGLGAPRRGFRSVDEQRALQGAMCLAGGDRLSGADVRAGAFLPGGVWFYMACFGAGTPGESVYHEWLRRLQAQGRFSGDLDAVLRSLPAAGDRPFVAALPQAALANPDGPLAVLGHVDLAWTYAFQDAGPRTISRASRFQGVFRDLLRRRRVGVAHRSLVQHGLEAAVDLSTRYGEDERAEGGLVAAQEVPEKVLHRAHLWMLRHDLLGYILLGDPAVRLPFSQDAPRVAAPAAPAAPGAAVQAASAEELVALGFAEEPRGGAREARTMIRAVREALREAATPAEIAAKHDVSEPELERWIEVYTEAGRAALERLAGRVE